jgi:thioredoxin reductase
MSGWDVAVIGGGPDGSVAALSALRANRLPE